MLFRQFGHRLRWQRSVLLAVALLVSVSTASAQYFDQIAMADMLNRRAASLDDVPEVSYTYYELTSGTGNSVYARNTFFLSLGKGDTEKGQAMAMLVGLLNRTTMNEVYVGDKLAVPTNLSDYDLDFRAYSPFPRYYTGGREFDKLFIMDKTLQAFAAYEYGELVRWGIINTGNPEESPTPNGRYNFNWREEFRVSSLSPPGEDWEMYWVVNFHQARGMHIHQYEMPTGGPMSHGCVRLVDADAEWAYNWVNTWKTTAKGDGFLSGGGRILEQGTTVLVIGKEPEGRPQPFEFTDYAPILKRVELPAHPYDIEPGTSQQRYFDRRRPARPAIAEAEPPPAGEEAAEEVPAVIEDPIAAEARPTEALAVDEEAPALKEPPAYEELPIAFDLTEIVYLPIEELPIGEADFALWEAPEIELLPVYDIIMPDEIVVAEARPLVEFPLAEATLAFQQAPDIDLPPIEEVPDEPLLFDRAQVSWTLVVASYTERADAEADAEMYRQKLDAYYRVGDVIEEASDGQTQYRVVVGQFETLQETMTTQQELGDLIPANAWQMHFTAVTDEAPEAPPAAIAEALPVEQEQPDEQDQAQPETQDQADDQNQPDDLAQPIAQDTLAVESPPVADETPTEQESILDEETPAEEPPAQPEQEAGPARFDLTQVSWTLVVASHTDQAAAGAEAEAYRQKLEGDQLVDVIEDTTGGQTQYRVVVGQFQTLTTTQAAQRSLSLPVDTWEWNYIPAQ